MSLATNHGPGSIGMPNGGVSMLIPLSFELGWTGLNEVFNSYPPPVPPAAATDATPVSLTPSPGAVTGGIPVPNGTSPDWTNPCTASVVPLTNSASGMILAANPKRNLLVVQNTSASGGPNMLVNFSQSASSTVGFALQPGQGLVLDVICPRDAVYVAWSGNNGAGMVMQGAFNPNNANLTPWWSSDKSGTVSPGQSALIEAFVAKYGVLPSIG